MLISACLVTYNEAHRIESTLNLIAPHVDEIVVVDQSSDDGTPEVVNEWANSDESENPYTTVLNDIHHGYCEPSRKKAHDASSGDWILVLDADEAISSDFANEIRDIPERGHLGVRVVRSLWIAGEHRFTGDTQYRYFHRNAARYLDEIHTEPQVTVPTSKIYHPTYVGIIHSKSWVEQIRDDLAYEGLIGRYEPNREAKLGLNVHLALLREKGITAEEADAMTLEERIDAGISGL